MLTKKNSNTFFLRDPIRAENFETSRNFVVHFFVYRTEVQVDLNFTVPHVRIILTMYSESNEHDLSINDVRTATIMTLICNDNDLHKK